MQATRNVGAAVAVLLLTSGLAWAGSENRLGTSGAAELRLPVGARTVALASSDLAMVGGAEALYFNPAGIVNTTRKTDVLFSHTRYIGDMNINYVGIAQVMGGAGSIGVSAKVLSVGDIAFTSETAPDGDGSTFSPTYATVGLTYGKQVTDRVNFGGTLTYISEHVLQTTAAGVAFDFGFQYDTGYRGMRLGVSMKSYGPNMAYGGSDFDFITPVPGDEPGASGRNVRQQAAAFELPASFQMALGLPVVQGANPVTLFGTYSSNSYGRDDGRIGAEWTLRKMLALRGGYHYNGDENDLFQWSYGVGVNVPVGASQLSVDYAGQPVNGGFFDDVQHLSVSLRF